MKTEMRQPPDDPKILQAAKENPNSWVYDIDWPYRDDQRVPPEAIRGSWKVDGEGTITGEFAANDSYRIVRDADSLRSLLGGSYPELNGAKDKWLEITDPSEKNVIGWWYVDKEGNLSSQFRPSAKYSKGTWYGTTPNSSGYPKVPTEGCEKCRKGVSKGEFPPELGVSDASHSHLHRCEVCGTYWEQTEREMHILSAEEAHINFPEAKF